MTTSSGFFVVLLEVSYCFALSGMNVPRRVVADTYIADNPLVVGEMWDTMDFRRSVILEDR